MDFGGKQNRVVLHVTVWKSWCFGSFSKEMVHSWWWLLQLKASDPGTSRVYTELPYHFCWDFAVWLGLKEEDDGGNLTLRQRNVSSVVWRCRVIVHDIKRKRNTSMESLASLILSFWTRWNSSVHLSHLPFFACPQKRPNCTPSLSLSLSFFQSCPPPPLFLSLVSSDTLVSLRVEEQRDSAMGLLEKESGGVRRGKKKSKSRRKAWKGDVRKGEGELVHPKIFK